MGLPMSPRPMNPTVFDMARNLMEVAATAAPMPAEANMPAVAIRRFGWEEIIRT